MEKHLRWALPLASAALVLWVRLLPLSLPSAEEWAVRTAREQVLNRVADEADSAEHTPAGNARLQAQANAWIAAHPTEFEAERRRLESLRRAELQYDGDDGHAHVYLGDVDSYHWLRMARNYLRSGTTCDAIENGECRNTFVNAPVGARMMYGRSLHIVAIVAMHRLLTAFVPGYPLPASSYWVPVLVGVLGVFPAFGIGRRLAGLAGGVSAAVLTGLDTTLLFRSLGSDDDVWNVVLPLFMMWAAIAALQSERRRPQVMYTLIAAGCAGLHAATWSGWIFTYAVLVAGLLANVILQSTCRLITKRSTEMPPGINPGRAGLIALLFYLAAGFFVTMANPSINYFALPARIADVALGTHLSTPADAPDASDDLWPGVLQAVGELAKPGLSGIIRSLGSGLYVCAGIVGFLFLLLPRGGWQRVHLVVFIGGCWVAAFIVADPALGRYAVLGLLSLLMIAAVAADRGAGAAAGGPELIVAIWFVASWYAAFGALRMILLLGPPFGLGLATLVGRAWDTLRPAPGDRYERLMQAALAVAVALALLQPIRAGVDTARNYTPRVNDAWWDTLTDLRERSSPGALINAWADDGYWIEYGAERHVLADGSSFLTHIVHWFAAALASANERESVGLLRMLDCGSDATPQPEGGRGAFQKVRAHVHDTVAAHDIVRALAGRSPAEARRYLTERGFSKAELEDVLQSTHCEPPDSYLLLSTDQLAHAPIWMHFALWDLRRAYIAVRAREETADAAVNDLVQHLGYSAQEARAAYAEARALSIDDLDGFVAPHPAAISLDWVPCRQRPDGTLACALNRPDIASGDLIGEFVYAADTPAAGTVRVSPAGTNDSVDVAPAALLLAGPDREQEITFSSPKYAELGILLDVANRRALFGAPALLRSMFVQLVYLDGRYTTHFEKVSEHGAPLGGRVVAWRINW